LLQLVEVTAVQLTVGTTLQLACLLLLVVLEVELLDVSLAALAEELLDKVMLAVDPAVNGIQAVAVALAETVLLVTHLLALLADLV
jgi:hypothetical protein